MAELNPLFVNIDNVYGSDELARPYRSLVGEGVVEAGDLLVTEAGTPNMSVDVAAGEAWVKGDHDLAAQPTYLCPNDATVNRGIAASDPTDPRKDIVVAEVLDDIFSGTSKLWQVRVVTGTPDPAPAEPALPLSAHKLAVVDVGAGVSAITDADITDTRIRAWVGGGAARGHRLAYGELTTLVNIDNQSSATSHLLATSGARHYDGEEVEIDIFIPFVQRLETGAAGSMVFFGVYDGDAATPVARVANIQGPGNLAVGLPVRASVSVPPPPGVHEYQLRAYVNSNDRFTAEGGVGGGDVFAPAFIRVRRA